MIRILRGRISSTLNLWPQVFSLVRYSGSSLALAVTLAMIAEAVLAIVGLWIIKLLIDRLASADATTNVSGIFLLVAFSGATTLSTLIVQSVANLLRTRQGLQVADYVDREIHQRAIAVDLEFYESPAYFDSLARARQAGTQRPAQMISNVLNLMKSVVFLFAVLILLAGVEWRLLPFLFIAVAAALSVRLHFTRRLYQWQSERTQQERRAAYLDWLLTSDHHAKELRLHELGAFLSDSYGRLKSEIRQQQLTIETAKAKAEIVVYSIGAIVFVGAIYWLVTRTLTGEISLGDLVLFVLLIRRAEVSGRDFVSNLSKLYEDQLYLDQLFSFLKVEPTLHATAKPKSIPEHLAEGLRLEGVSFTYPSQTRETLSNIDLQVPPGRLVALVGENGSGKTTLIKLLTRLYDPDQGRVTLEGTDVREFDPVGFRRLFSVIFQDFARYAATANENIWYGDTSREIDREATHRASKNSGAHGFLSELPRGYDTPLSRLFDDGQELSVGQWQRVALARAFFPHTSFIVMDEPTSAVDPASEMELFDTLRERIGGRGALIISHRLSTIRHVDYTYVLDRGRIVEHGTHEELIRAGGRYASLFDRQGAYFAS